MKTIKLNYSASEMNPWTEEMRVVDFNIESGIIYCDFKDGRINKRDDRGYIMIPMDEVFYKYGYYKVGFEFEMIIFVEWNDVKEFMDNTTLDDISFIHVSVA